MDKQAEKLDRVDPLVRLRDEFHVPTTDGVEDIYFVGNSLGLMPKLVDSYLDLELEKWKSLGVGGHFSSDSPWFSYHESLAEPLGQLMGAQADEVVVMNTLTVNLHLMLATFYRPTNTRYKILIEDHAFPSDQYAIDSQVRWHGRQSNESVIRLQPDHDQLISTEKICETIELHRDSLALVLLPGVQYYTGQVFDLAAITATAQRFEIPVGFDLAHAAGNIPMQLHDWKVDFAVWCNYKYLNSGPGAVGGCYLHQRHATNTRLERLAGWWGNRKESRFLMDDQFVPIPTAEGWQLSNPPILSMAPILASMDVFQLAGGIEPLHRKSVTMNRFFRQLLDEKLAQQVRVIAPAEQSGCQLSLELQCPDTKSNEIHNRLSRAGIRTDWRAPNVIRAAPVPLYNTFVEIERFVETLEELVC